MGGLHLKATGSIRPLDDLGRIVVPKVIRKKLNIVENQDYVDIYVKDGNIVLRKCLEGICPALPARSMSLGEW